MQRCDRDCFHCRFSDLIDGSLSPSDYIELVDLEYEQGRSALSEYVTMRSYSCPRCNRVLFEADIDLYGIVFIRCKRCKRHVLIETKPRIRRIGFV